MKHEYESKRNLTIPSSLKASDFKEDKDGLSLHGRRTTKKMEKQLMDDVFQNPRTKLYIA